MESPDLLYLPFQALFVDALDHQISTRSEIGAGSDDIGLHSAREAVASPAEL